MATATSSTRTFVRLCLLLLVTIASGIVWAQTAPSLGTAQSYAVLGGSTVTNTGNTIVTGNLGVSPGTAVTGFPPGTVVGGTTNTAASQEQTDATAAYAALTQTCTTTEGPVAQLGGLTLTPGVYCFPSSAGLTGTLTLDAQGNPNAVWVFDVASTLITASDATVVLVNGAQACNVFWQVGSSATLGTGTHFVGNILAYASITLTTGATMAGSALAQTGAVTMDDNAVAIAACAVPPSGPLPPTVTKAFSPATIDESGTSTLTITLNNPDPTTPVAAAAFTDTLPTGMTLTDTATTTCASGTPDGTSGGTSLSLSGGSIPVSSSCTVTATVTSSTPGSAINSIPIGALTTTASGSNAAPAVASLTVVAPGSVALSKAFSPASINAGTNATLTITLSNTNASTATGAAFTDTLPSGVTVASSGTTTCSPGTLTAATGSATVHLVGASIPASGSCTVTVPVTSLLAGSYFNTIPAGALTTNSDGTNAGPALATLTVLPAPLPPTLTKSFAPASFTVGGSSTLTLTLINPNATAATITSFTDTFPSGLSVYSAGSTTCGGSLIATVSTSTVSMTGGTIPSYGSCTITVAVTASTGSYTNTLPAGALVTNLQDASNTAPYSATLTVTPVIVPPTLGKTFTPNSITENGVSTLTITLSNANASVASLTAALIDSLPSGMVTDGKVTTTCKAAGWSGANAPAAACSGSSTTVSLASGASIPANGWCTVTVPVTAKNPGMYTNTLAIGTLQTSNGNNTASTSATLTVNGPTLVAPTLSKSFSTSSCNVGENSTLTITLRNANATAASLTAALIDSLPSGMEVSGSGSNTCKGTLSAIKNSSTVSLTGGSIPANGSCTITVPVTVQNPGMYTNTLAVGALQTSNGNNTASTSATLTATPPPLVAPTLSKSFSTSTCNVGENSTLTITLRNANATAASLTAALIDSLPSGMEVSGSGSNTCNGTLSAIKNSSTVSLSGGAIPANGSCTVTVPVTVKSSGRYTNTLPSGALHTSNGNNTASTSATLTAK